MAYTAWSVVFGEQPTAAKWNQLGTNDAGFRDGSNMAWTNPIVAGASSHIELTPAANKFVKIAVLRNDNASSTYKTKSIILTGWSRQTYPVAAAVNWTTTFGITFDAIPIIVGSMGGDSSNTSAAYGTGGNTVEGRLHYKTGTQTTTSFQHWVHQGAGANFASGAVFAMWIAIGEYSG